MFITREERLQNVYRTVEALYRKNYTNDQIAASVAGVSKTDVLDITQRIFGRDMVRRERGLKAGVQ